MQRFSKKRQAIFDCLCSTRSHPTADWIYQKLHPLYPDLSLGTVYRNLIQLKDAGLIRSIGVVQGHERFDATVPPHVHITCSQCGSVVDADNITLPPQLAEEAQNATGYLIEDFNLIFSGICPDCHRSISP